MEYKTKGKEGTSAIGQKKESKLGKVNKKRGKEKRDKADDISNNFPNFNALTKEEKLAFFEALSAARKNIEKRGLPTRERFGTVHDEYLQYFVQDDKREAVQKKPESAPSSRKTWSPVAGRRNPKESRLGTPDSPKQRIPRSPKPISPTPKKASKPPHKSPVRPESEPIDCCESVIKRDTSKMIQIYLNKKKKIEEQWKKASQESRNPPAKATAEKSPKAKNKERVRPESAKADSRAKTPSKSVDTPQFQVLNPSERKDFSRILKDVHTNVLGRSPHKENEALTLDEALKTQKGGGKVTTVCTATKDLQKAREQQKNLRVKVILTSGDNERLCRTKSQILNDSAKEGSGGRSKSLESMLSADTVHGKQSKIPILKRALQEKNECNDINDGTTTAKAAGRNSNEMSPAAAVREKMLAIEEEAEDKEMENIAEEKRRITKTGREKADRRSNECDENGRDANDKNLDRLKLKVLNLDKKKAEFMKAQKEKDRSLAEATRKEKDMLRKKKKEDRKRKYQKKEASIRKGGKRSKDCSCDSSDLRIVNKKITEEECVEEVEKELFEQKIETPKESGGRKSQRSNILKIELVKEEEEEEEGDLMEQQSEEAVAPAQKECLEHQTSSESQADAANECQQSEVDLAIARSTSSELTACEDNAGAIHQRTFSSKAGSEQVVKTATQSTKSLAGVSLVEEKPEEVWQSGKVIVVDDNVIRRIKDLIQYLEKKVNPNDNLESEYVRLILSYTEYLTKMTESLIRRNSKKVQQVHSTYAAPEVHLKFDSNGAGAPKEEAQKGHIQRFNSESEFYRRTFPGPSGIEKKEESRRKQSTLDMPMLSDSDSSSNSEEEYRTLSPSMFKKLGIPKTKVRLLQDLLKGRAKFEEGSIDDFKIVHYPEEEYVPPEKTVPTEQVKELSEGDADQTEKVVRMKFLRNLVRLCNCGRKQIEEDAILENLKGEAVRVDTTEGKKDPASATINQNTMEVLKAAERKKIIERYLKKDQS